MKHASPSPEGNEKIFFARRISFKVTMGIMVILALIFIASGYFAVRDQRKQMLRQLESYGNEMVDLVVEISVMPIRKFSIYQLEDLVAQLEKGENIEFCRIYDRQGSPLAISHPGAEDLEHDQKIEQDLMIIKKEIVSEGDHLGAVEMGFYLDSLVLAMDRVTRHLGYVIVFELLLIGMAITLFIYKIVVSPVVGLSRTTKLLAKGQFVTSKHDARKDEIGELVRSVNHMSGSLREMYRNLEKKVAERTEAIEKTNSRLKIAVMELGLRTREMSLFNQLQEQLQVCSQEEETYGVLVNISRMLFHGDSGFLAIMDGSSSLFKVVGEWGREGRGQPDFLYDSGGGLQREGALCEPIVIREEIVGVLHVELGGPLSADAASSTGETVLSKKKLAFSLLKHYAISLSNLRLRESLRLQSIRDPLTGLYNRRHMEESLDREKNRALRKGTPVGIMMIDVDHFKNFNDDHGHEAGDVVLESLGAFLKKRIRGEDIACRYGGEEFILILPEADLAATHARAEEIRRELSEDVGIRFGGDLFRITVSIGISVFTDGGKPIDQVIGEADRALYAAKAGGRNRVCCSGAGDG